MTQNDSENKNCASTQCLQSQKNRLFELREHLELYCDDLPVFGINSGKHYFRVIKSYLLAILVRKRISEPTVIKKTNQFIRFKLGDSQLSDLMKFLGRATSLDSILKAYKTSETKKFFPYETFDHPDKMQNAERFPYDAFYSELPSCNIRDTEYTDYVNLLKRGMTTEKAVVKVKKSKSPSTGFENDQKLQQIRKQQQRTHSKTFCAASTKVI